MSIPPIERVEIYDESSHQTHFTMIPNIVYRMGLDVWEFKAYSVLKYTAGDRGRCFKSNRTLSCEVGCSERFFIKLKESLVERKLIRITKQRHANGGSMPDLITIVDIWPQNFEYMMKLYPKNPDNNLEGFYWSEEKTAGGEGERRSVGGVNMKHPRGEHGSDKQEQKEQKEKRIRKQQQQPAAPVVVVSSSKKKKTKAAEQQEALSAPLTQEESTPEKTQSFPCLEDERCKDLSQKSKEGLIANCIELKKSNDDLLEALECAYAYDSSKVKKSRIALVTDALKGGWVSSKKEKLDIKEELEKQFPEPLVMVVRDFAREKELLELQKAALEQGKAYSQKMATSKDEKRKQFAKMNQAQMENGKIGVYVRNGDDFKYSLEDLRGLSSEKWVELHEILEEVLDGENEIAVTA